jgi:hypothetical protein
MTNELIEFIKGENGQHIGAVIALKVDETKVGVGWSLCKVKADRFDKKKALLIARGRAKLIRGKRNRLPIAIKDGYKRMVSRSEKYFKGSTIMCEFA